MATRPDPARADGREAEPAVDAPAVVGAVPGRHARSRRRLVLGALFVSLAVIVAALSARRLDLAALAAERQRLDELVTALGPWAAVIYLGAFVVLTVLCVPAGAALTILAGHLFGPLSGAALAVTGATAGATLAFLAARYLFRSFVEALLGRRFASLQAMFDRNDFLFLLALRLTPGSPFFLVNPVVGLSKMRVPVFVAATSLGMLPLSLVYALAGRELGRVSSLSDVLSGRVAAAMLALVALALLPVVLRRLSARTRRGAGS